jgi:HlyD family secretion protein
MSSTEKALTDQPHRRFRFSGPQPIWVWLLGFLVLVIALAVMFTMISKRKQPPAQRSAAVVTVSVQKAKSGSVPNLLYVSGTISATDPLTIGAEANGLQIEQVLVEEGTYVRRGQVLAVLDSSILTAQLHAAQARLAGSQANVTKAVQPNRATDIGELRAAYDQALADIQQRTAQLRLAEATLNNARGQAQRYVGLYQSGGVSQEQAEQMVTTARTARASVIAAQEALRMSTFAARQAQQRLTESIAGGRREDVIIAAATSRENAASVEQLRAQLAQTVVRAPDDGLITKRDAHIGDIATTGKALFQMVRRGSMELRAQVTQQDLANIRPGQAAAVTDGVRTSTGSVTMITPAFETTTRLGTVRIQLNGNNGFLPGMFAKANVNTGAVTAILVPGPAVQGDVDNYYVFILDKNNIARMRRVVIRGRSPEFIQVVSGLKAGEPVIVDGAGFLSDGDTVRLGK